MKVLTIKQINFLQDLAWREERGEMLGVANQAFLDEYKAEHGEVMAYPGSALENLRERKSGQLLTEACSACSVPSYTTKSMPAFQ